MLLAFTSLPGFVTLVFRGMPTVWRGRHRSCHGCFDAPQMQEPKRGTDTIYGAGF
jgi:hypothetical protein